MAVDPATLPYRPCVGMMLLNRDGLVFTGRRKDTSIEAWQMPQGGIDPGEDPEQAALRELREEVGTDRVRILGRTAEWLTYDLPPDLLGKVWGGRYRGQKQLWFALRLLGGDELINIATDTPEFCDWRWMRPEMLLEAIVPFKRAVYAQVIAELGHLAKPAPVSPV